MEEKLIGVGILVYYLGAFIILLVISEKIKGRSWIFRCVIKATLYSLLIFPGIFGGGGEPGIALPVPIPAALYFAPTDLIVENVVYPFLFWWTISFLFMGIVKIISYLIHRKNTYRIKNEQ